MAAARLRALNARIGRWPRRVAALLCLLLAAGSALVPTAPTTATGRRSGIGGQLHPGELAVPVPVSAASAALVRPGDRVGVVAADDSGRSVLVADGLRVLTVRTDSSGLSGDASALVVTAAARSDALELARYSADRLVLIVDQLP